MTSTTETINGSAYTTGLAYDDAGHLTSQTYPDGEVVATGYTAQGWIGSLATTFSGQSATTLVENMSYNGAAGALGDATNYGLGPQSGTDTYSAAFTYDALGRATERKITLTSTGAILFETTPGYDAEGNVVSVNTTLPQGTDNQTFCYDEQNRLAWAGSAGTPACGGTLTPGTLTSAQYTDSYTYDTLDRLTSSPLGSYTYGDSAHLHAATAVGSSYTASYDASGNMVCRAPTSAITCASLPTGAQLSYDNEGRLAAWQNAPGGSPTSTANYLYDGEGNRVLGQTVANGTTTTTTYIGTIEEAANNGSVTTTTSSYYLGAKRVAESVNGTISYLLGDGLNSAEVALNGSGSAISSQLYTPYGQTRYSNGSMPGTYGFTGQRDDTATTGLDYDTARYYDPTTGQFASADTVLPGAGYVPSGLNRFAYVSDNPESKTDPSGHCPPCYGALIGGIAGGGGDLLAQASEHGWNFSPNVIDYGRVFKFAAGGAVAGALAPLMGGAALGGAIVGGVESGILGLANPNRSFGSIFESVLGGEEAGIIGAGVGGSVGKFIGNIFEPVAAGAPAAWANGLANIASNAVGQWINGTFDKTSLILSGVAGFTGGALTHGASELAQAAAVAGGDFVGQVLNLKAEIQSSAESLGRSVVARLGSITTALGSAWSDAQSVAGSAWSDAQSIAGSAWSDAQSVAGSAWSSASNWVSSWL